LSKKRKTAVRREKNPISIYGLSLKGGRQHKKRFDLTTKKGARSITRSEVGRGEIVHEITKKNGS